MRLLKYALVTFIAYAMLSFYYLFVGLKLSALYSEFNIEAPSLLFNKFFLGSLLMALLSFVFWFFLKKQFTVGRKVSGILNNIILVLLNGPIIYYAVAQIYYLMIINIVIPLMD